MTAMFQDKYVFSQLIAFLNRTQFNNYVRKYDGNRYVKHFTCWNQMLAMMFGQLSNREGLWDFRIFEDFAFYMMKEACEKRTTNILEYLSKDFATSITQIDVKSDGMEYSEIKIRWSSDFLRKHHS